MKLYFAAIFYTLTALIAFAANSVLCRMALGELEIDAMSFVLVRLLSGSIMLVALVAIFEPQKFRHIFLLLNRARFNEQPSFASLYTSVLFSPFCLFLYAACFAYAYRFLDSGTGALILFSAVQITMITVTIFRGNRPNRGESIGLCIGFSGFLYLLYPNLTGPSLYGLVLMLIAGIAWGAYSLFGQKPGQGNSIVSSPLVVTARNFLFSLPFACLLLLISFDNTYFSLKGLLLGIVAGGLTSGLGYAIWYKALLSLNTTQAAVSQLSVPILASIGGIIWLNESFSLHLLMASILVLGGILMVVLSHE